MAGMIRTWVLIKAQTTFWSHRSLTTGARDRGHPTMATTPDPRGLPEPGGLSERLWLDAQPEVFRALHNPFVAALGLGTLPKCAVARVARLLPRLPAGKGPILQEGHRRTWPRWPACAMKLHRGLPRCLAQRATLRPQPSRRDADAGALPCALPRSLPHTPPPPAPRPAPAQGLLPPLRRPGRPLPPFLRPRLCGRRRQGAASRPRGGGHHPAAAHGRCAQAQGGGAGRSPAACVCVVKEGAGRQ